MHTRIVIGLALVLLIGCSSTRGDIAQIGQPVSTPPPAPTATSVPTLAPSITPTPTSSPSATLPPSATAMPAPTASPAPTDTPTPISVNGQVYDAYIAAATKPEQAYQYSCEFDAAWVILHTYGIAASPDDLIAAIAHDRSIEPYYEETAHGFLIYGGDIIKAYSGDYTHNFLARSTGGAMQPVFARYGLVATPVSTREAVESALRRGALVWMKTTVDFKSWRPATWIMPDGRTYQTVLGNDHAVVVMGFNRDGVVIRDVLGPTSSNWERPDEYSVDWDTFMTVWQAQSFDGLAVDPPR